MIGRRGTFVIVGLLTCAILTGSFSAGQDRPADDGKGCQLGPEVVSVWEFGMEVTAGTDSGGIMGTVPVPVDWPEQSVELVAEQSSERVARISFKDLAQDARQMVFRINQLPAGESGRAAVTVRIRKHHLTAPPEPAQLRFADPVPSRYRQYLRPSPYIESNDSRIEEIAQSLVKDQGMSDFEHAERIYRWVRERVAYEFDTQIRTTLEALDAGRGDCEELSSLYIAILRAQGIPARAVWVPEHTYPEFLMVDAENRPCWIPCQIAGDYEFGAMSEDRPILQKGDRFKIAGEPKPVRYVKPTLLARQTSGGLKLSWIMRQAGEEEAKTPSDSTDEPETGGGGLFGGGRGTSR